MYWKSIVLIFAVLLAGCSEKPSGNASTGGEQNPPEEQTIWDSLSSWTDVSSQYGELPQYIKVYKSPSKLQDKNAVAYVAVADMTYAEWDIWSITDPEGDGSSETFKTPSKVYSEESWPIIINAGFFYADGGKRYASSLAVKDSKVLTYNINYAVYDWGVTPLDMRYPTRAAFCEYADGTFDACYVYNGSFGDYMYQSPANNSWSKSSGLSPSATYPSGGKRFAAVTAIGGGPALINKGKFTDSYEKELFNGPNGIAPDSNQPRTAIGVTKDRKLVLFVCEGRQMTSGVAGFTTADVADILLDLKCVEAINLDGGGSSCMLVNGKETIKVSDGSQRPVGSTIMIK